MNFFRKTCCRVYQKGLYVAMAFMPWRQPELITGEGCFDKLSDLIVSLKLSKPLVVTDKNAVARGVLDGFSGYAPSILKCTVFDGVLPNPTVKQVEEGFALYKNNCCDCIVAVGGGSVMDCAKAIGARIVKPQLTVNDMKGLLKVNKKLPPLFAVPTTAGTGSECTVCAVITDSDNSDKYAINDFSLTPKYAVLDPKLTVGLPPFLTATTGMDALTHAVEAYIGHSNTAITKQNAEDAVRLIFANLPKAFADGTNMSARQNMQYAAYLAGLAFTRAYVGYTHALAHALGGVYGTAHGLANAVLLPQVLQAYGKSVHKPLARLAVLAGVAFVDDSQEVAANKFIEAIYQLNQQFGIPATIDDLKEQDVYALASHADKEANPLYPVPKELNKNQLAEILRNVLNTDGAK